MAFARVDKLLSNAGYGSRREIAAAAKNGEVLVDGEICRQAERKIDTERSVLTFRGEALLLQTNLYLMLYKPAGVITATKDATHQTVLDLLPPRLQRMGLFAVGRLDKDTEGLLLLTTDGSFDHALMSPRGHVPKVYDAKITGTLAADAEKQFEQGLVLADGTVCQPAVLQRCAEAGRIRVTLYEGKYHQVKRMVRAVGATVCSLRRIAIGPLRLDPALAPGEFRELSEQEHQALLQGGTRRLEKSSDGGTKNSQTN